MKKLILTLAVCAGAAPAFAANELPMEHGIYVKQEVNCVRATPDTMLFYWTGGFGLGGVNDKCKLNGVTFKDDAYIVAQTCNGHDAPLTITIQNSKQFTVGATIYRLCDATNEGR